MRYDDRFTTFVKNNILTRSVHIPVHFFAQIYITNEKYV